MFQNTLDWVVNLIRKRYLRNRYENKCYPPCDCCGNLAGNTADYRLQLWGKAISSCAGGLSACSKMELGLYEVVK